jgi:hypothetical protein
MRCGSVVHRPMSTSSRAGPSGENKDGTDACYRIMKGRQSPSNLESRSAAGFRFEPLFYQNRLLDQTVDLIRPVGSVFWGRTLTTMTAQRAKRTAQHSTVRGAEGGQKPRATREFQDRDIASILRATAMISKSSTGGKVCRRFFASADDAPASLCLFDPNPVIAGANRDVRPFRSTSLSEWPRPSASGALPLHHSASTMGW